MKKIINKFKGLSIKKKLLIGGFIGLIVIGAITEQESTSNSIVNNDKVEQVASEEIKQESNDIDKIKFENKESNLEQQQEKDYNKEKINEVAKLAVLKTLKDKFEPQGIKVNAISKDNVYMVNLIPNNGFSKLVIKDTQNNGGYLWGVLKLEYINISEAVSSVAREQGSDLTFAISILNDSNLENTLLTVSDGKVVYDFSEN